MDTHAVGTREGKFYVQFIFRWPYRLVGLSFINRECFMWDSIVNFFISLDAKTYILALSATAAVYSINRNTTISRRRATVDLILIYSSE